MKFRPCIDIHNGKVKQIIGGSLLDAGNAAEENFVSDKDAGYYAQLYRTAGLTGGHIILLNPEGSEYYEADVEQAAKALKAYPMGMQIGGGMNADNAIRFLEMGARQVIVTSYVFQDGKVHYNNLEKLVKTTEKGSKKRLVLDLSCRKRENEYYIVTDRWQKFTEEKVTLETLNRLSTYCDEFLIHAVDVEGKASGIETELAALLGEFHQIPVTYAGGVGTYDDLRLLKKLGRNRVDVTIGSALDLFGGPMEFEEVQKLCQ